MNTTWSLEPIVNMLDDRPRWEVKTKITNKELFMANNNFTQRWNSRLRNTNMYGTTVSVWAWKCCRKDHSITAPLCKWTTSAISSFFTLSYLKKFLIFSTKFKPVKKEQKQKWEKSDLRKISYSFFCFTSKELKFNATQMTLLLNFIYFSQCSRLLSASSFLER